MSRFYQTTDSNYNEDFIFAPDFEFINKSVDKANLELDNILIANETLKNLPLKHLNHSTQKSIADEIKNYYGSKANELVDMLKQDYGNIRKVKQGIREVSSEYLNDKNIKALEYNYNEVQKYMDDENNKKIKASNPDKYNRGLTAILKPLDDPTKDPLDPLNSMTLMEDKNFATLGQEIYKDMKASSLTENFSETHNGWIVSGTNSEKGVSEDRLQAALLSAIASDPTIPSYALQQNELGYNEDYDVSNAFYVEEVPIKDKDGKVVKQKILKINENSAYAPALSMMQSLAYQDIERGVKSISRDPLYMEQVRTANDASLEKLKSSLRITEKQLEKSLEQEEPSIALGFTVGSLKSEEAKSTIIVESLQEQNGILKDYGLNTVNSPKELEQTIRDIGRLKNILLANGNKTRANTFQHILEKLSDSINTYRRQLEETEVSFSPLTTLVNSNGERIFSDAQIPKMTKEITKTVGNVISDNTRVYAANREGKQVLTTVGYIKNNRNEFMDIPDVSNTASTDSNGDFDIQSSSSTKKSSSYKVTSAGPIILDPVNMAKNDMGIVIDFDGSRIPVVTNFTEIGFDLNKYY